MVKEKHICGIHRIEKHNRQAIGGLQNENNRDDVTRKKFDNSDVDYDRTHLNAFYKKNDDWHKYIKSRFEKENVKVTKASVWMLDGLYTASPDWFKGKTEDEIKSFFDDCYQWHIKTYCHNDDTLVVNAVIHYDETTPHLHVVSMPITEDGRLCAKDITGNKKAYSERQDSFYEDVTKSRGLERGEIHEPSNRRKYRTAQEKKVDDLNEEIQEKDDVIQQQNIVITDLQQQVVQLTKEKEDQIAENQRIFNANQKLVQERNDHIQEINRLKGIEDAYQKKINKRIMKPVLDGNRISEVKGQGEADTRYGNP